MPILLAVLAFVLVPYPAKAGLLATLFKIFSSGKDGSHQETALAVLSRPLLGSQGAPAIPAVGGPTSEPVSPLPSTQDNALVASKNPMGTLPSVFQDEILIYTVVGGDTPGAIAERFGISLNTLLWANNIANPNLIKVGDELIILPVTGVKYEVKKGDTIEAIAKKFKGDVDEILSFNGLATGEPLEVGSVLIIPDGEIVPPLSAPSTRSISSFSRLPEYSGYYMKPIFGGRRSRGLHGFNGIDLADSCGSPVLSSAPGTIIIARPSGWNGGYGKYVVISHANGTQTLYAHLSSILGKIGQYIAQGSQIATVGSTGNSTGCHVHFEVRGARNPF